MLQHIHLEMSSDCSLESIISYLRVVLSLSSFSAQSNRRVFLVLFSPCISLNCAMDLSCTVLPSGSQHTVTYAVYLSIHANPCGSFLVLKVLSQVLAQLIIHNILTCTQAGECLDLFFSSR